MKGLIQFLLVLAGVCGVALFFKLMILSMIFLSILWFMVIWIPVMLFAISVGIWANLDPWV